MPNQLVKEPFDYPWKFRPAELQRSPQIEWRYRAQNLRFEYDRFAVAQSSVQTAVGFVDQLATFMCGPFEDWSEATTAADLREQLQTDGEDAWIERVWLEDLGQER